MFYRQTETGGDTAGANLAFFSEEFVEIGK
jgi:hypothetical protein